MATFEQMIDGMMHYPERGTLNRFIFKSPLVLWRMGLGPLLGKARMMVLTTRGRRSGLPRHAGLSYGEIDGIKYGGSGWGAESDWYKNMIADPHVTIQAGEGVEYAFGYRVTDLEEYKKVMMQLLEEGGDAYMEPWLESLDIAPDLDDMITKRDRVYLVGFRPTDEPGPEPMETDLIWLWPVLAVTFALGWLFGWLLGR
jgi:deazaflavin-dependent oxidoreductase (nitroreductase family)